MTTQLNSNVIYLTVDGISLAARFTEVSIGQTGNEVEVTVGAATFTQRQGGLSDSSIDFTVGYDTATISAYIQKMKPNQVYVIDYGPEGNTAGKPRHTQSFFIKSVDGPNLTVQKDMATFKVSGSGADAPTANIYAGATF